MLDQPLAEGGAGDFLAAGQQSGQIVGGDAGLQGAGQGLVDQLRGLAPTQVLQEHGPTFG